MATDSKRSDGAFSKMATRTPAVGTWRIHRKGPTRRVPDALSRITEELEEEEIASFEDANDP